MTHNTGDFWLDTPLERMTEEQWEALCDGCAKCCLHRLEDEETREIHFTNVCCRYLDQASCRCIDYSNRSRNVPECVQVTPAVLQDPYWLPRTCAYRLLAEGSELPAWHPLRSGSPDSVSRTGNTVCGRCISELEADDLEHHLVEWVG